MRLPTPRQRINRSEEIIDSFGGLNTTENIAKNELSLMLDMDHSKFPFLATRPPRRLLKTLTKANALFTFKDIYTVDGTSFKKGDVVIGTVTDSKKCMIEFNLNILIFPDKKYYDTVSGTFGSFTSPDIDFACVHNNRVFGVKDANIYACKQGDFKNWSTFEGLNTDSWATDVAGAVTFKSICSYQNHIVMSTEKNMYELYGYKPSNFQVQEVAKIGALSNYVEAESVLYFANNNGLYAYAGGVPRLVTERLSAPFPLGPSRLGSDGKNIFFSTEHFIVVYNLPTGLLSAQQGNGVVDFSFYEEKLYALFSNGKLQKFNDITALETINWMITLPTNYGDYFKNKTIKHIEVHAVMQTGSKMDFKIYHRNEQRETYVKTVQSSSQRAIVVPLNVLTNEFNLTIEGKGDVQINAIKVVYIKGGTL